jgi:thiosulfate dehydrogenase [quinone] large subunit
MSPGVLQGEVATAGGSGGGAEGLLVGPDGNLRFADWLFRSKAASVIWLVARLWLGYEWLNAGYQKLFGAEKAAFWNGGGVGVKGFAGAGVAGSATGKGGASYGWFAAFLHNFVIPNASWIAKLVTVSEVVIGILLLVGLFTGAAAFCGIGLNVIYMFSGSAGVNPAYALVSVFLILAWRNAGYIGLDRLALPAVSGWLHSHGGKRHGATRTPKVVLPAH